MKPMTLIQKGLPYAALFLALFSCSKKSNIPTETPLSIVQDSATAQNKAEETLSNTPITVAKGLELSLWATDSLAPDPIAMDIDTKGNVYLTRTNRQKHSEFDIRGYRDWMIPSISLQTVEERRNFLHEVFAPEKSDENSWLEDLNKDSIHDWHDLTVEREEVWKLEDVDGNGMADKSTRILNDFHDEVTDVAGALLVRDHDVFVGVAPDMWRLTDTNGDEVLDTKESLVTGFDVHIGFSGHGMSGARQGPDGKIYWGIGDIGADLTSKSGEHFKYPNQGVIVRCNPDGSDFEVYAHGLRNTHEFVFDEYGNIISSDNDGDHQGESERLVHIVEGSDAGWRSNWQYGKYVDPKNNSYKVWMDEKMYTPHWEGQAAYFIPPIVNYHNGPTGMAYNPGTALGSNWVNHFFLVEFVGDPALSHIWSFDLKPKGASFDLNSEEDVVSGILPTGIKFGPDGALYVADWLNGWGTKNAGRVWKLDVSARRNDMDSLRKKTQELMQFNYEEAANDTLIQLLHYPDMRIREKAQFQLAKSTFWGYRALKKLLEEDTQQLARIHAIWAIGQMAGEDVGKAEALMPYLKDEDPEIVAQTAKVLGDVRYQPAAEALLPLLEDEHPRVQFFGAQALGRLAYEPATQPLIQLLERNADQDLYIRHAATLALSRIGAEDAMAALVGNPNKSLRLAAVLVLRKLQSPKIAPFLQDQDEYIVAEAARAVNDDWSIEAALPALAKAMNDTRFTSEPLLRRSINAALRVGGDEQLKDLIAFAKRPDVTAELRGEALATIGTWAEPSVLDRVDGRLRGEIHRNPEQVKNMIQSEIPTFLKDKQTDILIGTAKLLGQLQLQGFNKDLKATYGSAKDPKVRSAVLMTLGQLHDPEIGAYMQRGMADKDYGVRQSAIALLDQLDIPAQKLPQIVGGIFTSGSEGEQQAIVQVLGNMPREKSGPVLASLIDRAGKGRLPPAVILDLKETVEHTQDTALIAKLDVLKKMGYGTDSYKEALYGGHYWNGREQFRLNPTAQCVRCHSVDGSGGKVGPPLDNIGNTLSREQLLEALVNPSARLAPGYGSVTLTLKDGQQVTGILEKESSRELVLRTNAAEPLVVPVGRIKTRKNQPSGMPPMGRMIEKRELRDIIEYLSTLKKKQ